MQWFFKDNLIIYENKNEKVFLLKVTSSECLMCMYIVAYPFDPTMYLGCILILFHTRILSKSCIKVIHSILNLLVNIKSWTGKSC